MGVNGRNVLAQRALWHPSLCAHAGLWPGIPGRGKARPPALEKPQCVGERPSVPSACVAEPMQSQAGCWWHVAKETTGKGHGKADDRSGPCASGELKGLPQAAVLRDRKMMCRPGGVPQLLSALASVGVRNRTCFSIWWLQPGPRRKAWSTESSGWGSAVSPCPVGVTGYRGHMGLSGLSPPGQLGFEAFHTLLPVPSCAPFPSL